MQSVTAVSASPMTMRTNPLAPGRYLKVPSSKAGTLRLISLASAVIPVAAKAVRRSSNRLMFFIEKE